MNYCKCYIDIFGTNFELLNIKFINTILKTFMDFIVTKILFSSSIEMNKRLSIIIFVPNIYYF